VLEMGEVGQGAITQIRFTEMISNIAVMTDPQLVDWLQEVVKNYAQTVYLAKQAIDHVIREWTKKSVALDRNFVVTV
jgi:hypothetical protein